MPIPSGESVAARARFGGTEDDYVAYRVRFLGQNLRAEAANTVVTFWDSAVAGTQYTDLLDEAGFPITQVTSTADGQLPLFYGPDNVLEVWADAGAGDGTRRRMEARLVAQIADSAAQAAADATRAENAAAAAAASGSTDTAMASRANDAASAFRAAMNVLFIPQSKTGIKIGDKRFATIYDAVVDVNANGGTIFVRGDYTLSDGPPVITHAGARIAGDGEVASVLRAISGAGDIIRFGSKSSTAQLPAPGLKEIRLVGAPGVSRGVNVIAAQSGYWADVWIDTLPDVGAWAWVFDTASAGSFPASINNAILGGYINSCYNGLQFTKDPADTGSDGSNHNTVVAARVAGFHGIGYDIDAGENNSFHGVDASSSFDGATSVRINDDVTGFYQVRADNSSGTGNTATGIHITPTGRDYLIMQPTGNGPTSRILRDDLTITGRVFRQGFNADIGHQRRALAATGSDYALLRPWTNVSATTITANNVAYWDATCGEGEVKRADGTARPNPLVCVEAASASGGLGQFADPGSVVTVNVDSGRVDNGDTLVVSTANNGSAMADNTQTDPRFILGKARTSKAAGASGTVKVYVR